MPQKAKNDTVNTVNIIHTVKIVNNVNITVKIVSAVNTEGPGQQN